MDRTAVDTPRTDEKYLNELVYKKLEMLTVIQTPTTEFNSIFSEDMFIRPNSKAFIHVMHFLFSLYDINEFKRRIFSFWPITDKKSESNFRSSILEYLQYLKIKHNCEWMDLNRSLLVMPGGHKFLLFLNDFLEFVAKELIKQREKYLPKNVHLKDLKVTKTDFIKLETQNKVLKINAVAYAEYLDSKSNEYKKCSNILYNMFMEISRDIKIPILELLKPDFLNDFKKFVDKQFKNNVTKKIDNICNFEKYIDMIQEHIELHQTEKTPLQYDKSNLIFNTNEDSVGENFVKCNDINLANLMGTFIKILPELNKILLEREDQSLESLEFQFEELEKMKNKVLDTNLEIIELSSFVQKGITEHVQAKDSPIREEISNDLLSKYVQTPPINQNFSRIAATTTRLPMMEDNLNSTIQSDVSFVNHTLMSLQRSVKKSTTKRTAKNEDNRSKVFDPSNFLRCISKNKMSSKKKPNQTNTRNDYDTPHAKIEKKLFSDKLLNTSPAFQKVQNTSKQIEKLSTSPTGRLEALVKISDVSNSLLKDCILEESIGKFNAESNETMDILGNLSSSKEFDPVTDNIRVVPKILINDISLKDITDEINDLRNRDVFSLNDQLNKTTPSKSSIAVKNENKNVDLNCSNLISNFNILNINENDVPEDNIYNISDCVLNDIEM